MEKVFDTDDIANLLKEKYPDTMYVLSYTDVCKPTTYVTIKDKDTLLSVLKTSVVYRHIEYAYPYFKCTWEGKYCSEYEVGAVDDCEDVDAIFVHIYSYGGNLADITQQISKYVLEENTKFYDNS